MSKVTPNTPLLILLYGFPGSGKTYLARQLTEQMNIAHVHADRIRNELFEEPRYDKEENQVVDHLMDYMTGQFLNAGTSVIFDVNATRAVERRRLRDMARKYKATPILVWQQIDTETAFQRASKRDRRRADDKYAPATDRAEFERIAGSMQNPNNEDYVVVSGKHIATIQVGALIRYFKEQGLVSMSAEGDQKMVKPGLVNIVPSYTGRVDLSRRNINIR